MKNQIARRKKRVRAKMIGTNVCPRISVFRSNRHLYVQAIDDQSGKTLCFASDKKLAEAAKTKKPVERAKELGVLFTENLKGQKVKKAVFDRGAYKYHGAVKALCEGLREGGIEL